MIPFKATIDQLDLDVLPPLSESPGYKIVRGDPRCSIRFDVGGAGESPRLGVWRCTEGAFACTEKGNELQTLLQGVLTLTTADGNSTTFKQGDSFYTVQGEEVVWDIVEDVTKVFFTLQE